MKRKLRHKIDEKVKADRGIRFIHLLKYFFVAAMLIAATIMLPITLVWKQVYITNASMHHDSLKDSLAVLNKEVATLNIIHEQLSSTERVESIAKESLGLDYPLSKEIIVVRPEEKRENSFILDSPFWAVLKKSITPGKG